MVFGIDFEALKLHESNFKAPEWYLESFLTNSKAMKRIVMSRDDYLQSISSH